MTIVLINTIISIIYYISTLNTIITNINKIILTLLILITYYIVDSPITGIITICTVIIINTKDIRNIYLWLEAYTLSTYILLYWKQNKQIRKEGIKYYIIGGISSSIVLLGIYLIYRERGITTYPDISGIGVTIMTIGLILKLGTYPFTNWIIKIYPLYKKEIYNAIILIPQIGIIYTIDRNIENIRTIKYVIIITIIYGMILGLKYKTYKKILISSSIMNTGIILILSITGSKLLITYIIIYVITTTQITTTLSKNTSKTNIIISIISIIGIPPLLGWYGKASIIRELITKEKIYVSLIIISTIISTIYYLIIIAPYIYEKTTTRKDKETISIIKSVYSVLITTTYIIIGYIWPYQSII